MTTLLGRLLWAHDLMIQHQAVWSPKAHSLYALSIMQAACTHLCSGVSCKPWVTLQKCCMRWLNMLQSSMNICQWLCDEKSSSQWVQRRGLPLLQSEPYSLFFLPKTLDVPSTWFGTANGGWQHSGLDALHQTSVSSYSKPATTRILSTMLKTLSSPLGIPSIAPRIVDSRNGCLWEYAFRKPAVWEGPTMCALSESWKENAHFDVA